MDIKLIIEIIGYTGSALVLVSMLMTSVVRLRIINLIGSVIFALYALAIQSYPTALMNICLAGINVYHLVRIFKEQKIYSLIETAKDDAFFSYLLEKNHDDIMHWFPEYDPADDRSDLAYLICCDSNPACLFLGTETNLGELEVILDYATPVYRDTSVGRYLYRQLAKKGYKTLVFKQRSEGHIPYMNKIGYVQGDNKYTLELEKML
ncbi:MAG: YgjV family protein [Lachnospiraceae bacterium]|nr:YgjV family protein [Lachnospiraceae bacterium]